MERQDERIARHKLEPLLEAGESLLWAGHPKRYDFRHVYRISASNFDLFVLAAIVVSFPMWMSLAGFSWADGLAVTQGGVLAVAGLGLYLFLGRQWYLHSLYYGISDRRVLLLNTMGRGQTLSVIGRRSCSCSVLHKFRDGRGTIVFFESPRTGVFTNKRKSSFPGDLGETPRLEQIADPDRAYALIQELVGAGDRLDRTEQRVRRGFLSWLVPVGQ